MGISAKLCLLVFVCGFQEIQSSTCGLHCALWLDLIWHSRAASAFGSNVAGHGGRITWEQSEYYSWLLPFLSMTFMLCLTVPRVCGNHLPLIHLDIPLSFKAHCGYPHTLPLLSLLSLLQKFWICRCTLYIVMCLSVGHTFPLGCNLLGMRDHFLVIPCHTGTWLTLTI